MKTRTKTEASAPGKIILFGEHAVVYGRPAIAIPLAELRATAAIQNSKREGIRLVAPDLNEDVMLADLDENNPFAFTLRLFKQEAGIKELPNLRITVRSAIPIASGLGSGAAITAAVLRGLAQHFGISELNAPGAISDMTYQVEMLHHGTPSGVDNTVVAYEKPVYFSRQTPENRIEPFTVKKPLNLLIGITGKSSHTISVVADVRRQWEADQDRWNRLFDSVGRIAKEARVALEQGDLETIGHLMSDNHRWLHRMTVSSPELDKLVGAAESAGALGAKLSGAGRGGTMIALVTPETQTAVSEALTAAGATTIYATTLQISK